MRKLTLSLIFSVILVVFGSMPTSAQMAKPRLTTVAARVFSDSDYFPGRGIYLRYSGQYEFFTYGVNDLSRNPNNLVYGAMVTNTGRPTYIQLTIDASGRLTDILKVTVGGSGGAYSATRIVPNYGLGAGRQENRIAQGAFSYFAPMSYNRFPRVWGNMILSERSLQDREWAFYFNLGGQKINQFERTKAR